MKNPPPLLTPLSLNAESMRAMLQAGLQVLHQHKDEVDRLNVFPVPDGDTGMNMSLTLQSAWAAVEVIETTHVGELLQVFAAGAIRGARGNSGVILSQLFRGMADEVADSPKLDARSLARAFRRGQKTAYQGVMQPVEGTILTIMRAVADACEHSVPENTGIGPLFAHCLQQARESLARTPDMLPILKQAGVVDAGGQGLIYILEGMTRWLSGEEINATAATIVAPATTPTFIDHEDAWGYDVQYLIFDAAASAETIQKRLSELGGHSIVIAQTDRITKVHVHGDNPGSLLSYGASLGHLDDIVIENMTLQTWRQRGQWPQNESQETSGHPCNNIVAVAPGPGFAQVFQSLGVCQIVAGGQTMNPSTEAFLQALAQISAPEALILPNNKNSILAARQAAEMSPKPTFVVETQTPVQGIGALLAFNATQSAASNQRQMQAMAAMVRTIEITTAVRTATLNGVHVPQGSAIALVDGTLCCHAVTPEGVTRQALASLAAAGDYEIITLYFGQQVTPDQAQTLTAALQLAFPLWQIDCLPGGQPHYHYIISAE